MEHFDTDSAALRSSEERLRAFMAHSPLLAFMKDACGRYVFVNPRMEREFGISRQAILGRADVDWLPPDTARTVQENDRRVLASGGTLEVVESLPGNDGQLRHWLVNKFVFTSCAGERFIGGLAMDVTALKRAEAMLAASEERYRHLVEHSLGLICTHDLSGRLLSINPAALRQIGYSEEEMIGRSLSDMLSPSVRAEFPRYLERVLSTGEDTGLMVVVTKAGALRTWQYHNVCVGDQPDKRYVLGHAQDVTELRDTQQELRRLSITDELTGLLNRRGFFSRGSQFLQNSVNANRSVAAFYADVNGLKRINDHFGHDAGSRVLVAAAQALTQTFRAADVLGRIGGDEFAVLAQLPADTTPIIRKRLDDHVSAINRRSVLPAPLAVTLGEAHLLADDPTTLDELLCAADNDMYARKAAQRRRISPPCDVACRLDGRAIHD